MKVSTSAAAGADPEEQRDRREVAERRDGLHQVQDRRDHGGHDLAAGHPDAERQADDRCRRPRTGSVMISVSMLSAHSPKTPKTSIERVTRIVDRSPAKT